MRRGERQVLRRTDHWGHFGGRLAYKSRTNLEVEVLDFVRIWWACTYRIANFSLGSPNISSRAKTLDKPHDLMFGRERPSHYRPTCEHSNKSRSASSHHPSQEHRGCDNHRRVSPRLNSILGHGLAESPSKTPPAGRTVTNDEMKPARLALHGAMNAFYVVQGTLRARFLGGSDL